tara:strand:+ start:34852 stop:37950 length:3099 start_codon:yes stop_codon:yes gene_type:complete
MSLFQHSVLNKYLKEANQDEIRIAHQKLVGYFHDPVIQQNIRESKEEQWQEGFLIELFANVLGYTINPNPDYNLTTEFKNERGSKKADGAILIDGAAIGVIELKSTKTKDLEAIRLQAFDYKANQSKCVYVITSNFEKVRFYINNAVEFEEFDLFRLEYDHFQLLWLCLAKANLLKGVPLAIKEASILKEENVTKQIYIDYSAFKRDLYNDLILNNLELEIFSGKEEKEIKLTLFKKSQKLLDRFLFIFFGEDRGLLPPNSISEIVKQWEQLKDLDEYKPLYERYQKYFNYLNTGWKGKKYEIFAYNGGLFAPDEILDTIIISDEILKKHTNILTGYDFETEVDVNILGHIFENSLNEIEEVAAQIEGAELDLKKSKRKKDGVFYTPKYITKYIVESTVGKLCDEKKSELNIDESQYLRSRKGRTTKKLKELDSKLSRYRDWLLTLTICDPACGSGAFLNQALDFLIREHRYIDELRAKMLDVPMIFTEVENSILENNIYGVDINEESVEIAKLSLWLRTAQKGRKLTTLSNNIKCGNSLIDDSEVAGEKAFNWKNEFPEVFKNGGFDVVIGNPPYVDIKALDNNIVTYLFEKFQSANNRVNLYSSFVERSIEILNKNKYFSFIIPSSLLTQESYKELRKILLHETTLTNIVRLPNESFGGSAGEVKVDTIILSYKKSVDLSLSTEIIIYKGFDRINEITTFNADFHFFINSFDWKKDESYIFRINTDNTSLNILDKCETKAKKLFDCADFCLGLTPYDKYKGHTQEQIRERVFHAGFQKDDTFKKLLAGNDITRYHVEWGGAEWISYGKWLGAPREPRFFKQKRILIKQIIDWSDKRIWASITDEEFYNTQNAFNLVARDGYIPEYLIALINSKLFSFYHRKKYLEEFKDRFQKILIKDAKEFPIKQVGKALQEQFAIAVNKIIISTNRLREHISPFCQLLQSKLGLKKLSVKLQKWHELEFSEFSIELKKAKVKLTLSEEAEWMQYFNEQKQKAQALKSEIGKIDREIDSMVYELYGLTEEEIGIVEESF